MRSLHYYFPYSVRSFCFGIIGVLVVTYIGLIAVVMSYATLTVEFSQSVKNDETVVASLEAQYLSEVAHITSTNYVAAGYALPVAKRFVPTKSATALR